MAKYTVYGIALSMIIFASTPNLILADPAIHIERGVCDIDGPEVTESVSGMVTFTQSPNGNILMVCQGQVSEPPDGKTFVTSGKETGKLCYVDGLDITTDDWHLVVSASGKATLSCHVKI